MKGLAIRVERALGAFAVAPIGSVAVMIAFVAFHRFSKGLSPPPPRMLLGIAIIFYPIPLILGIPGYFLLRRLGWIRRAHWILLFTATSCAVATVLPIVMPMLFSSRPDASSSMILGFGICGLLCGAVSGAIFAWVVRVQRPLKEAVATIFD
jgi:hypothetical protein